MRTRTAVMTSLMGLFSLCVSGCTAIGFVVGSSIDDSNATVDTSSVETYSQLENGTQTIILSKDGSVVRGIFLGTEDAAPEVYRKQYNDWHARSTSQVFSTGFGDSITVILKSEMNRQLVGEFAGFTETSIKIRQDGGPPYNDVVTTTSWNIVDSVYDNQENRLSGNMLMSAIASGDIPTPTQLVVKQSGDSVRIPSYMVLQIRRLDTNRPNKGRITGAAIGFVADVAVVGISVAQQSSHMFGSER